MRLALTSTIALLLATSPAIAGVSDVSNIADILHPNIHQNVTGGNNENPNAANDGGGELHGIATVPGQSDINPAGGQPGIADQLQTVHGGMGAVNKNAN